MAPTGALTTRYAYQPFGRTTVTGIATSTPFQFTGRENDGNDLYYYRTRYYSSTYDRFLSEDANAGANDAKRYQYVENSPLDRIDPTGQDWWNPSTWGPAARTAAAIFEIWVNYQTGGKFGSGMGKSEQQRQQMKEKVDKGQSQAPAKRNLVADPILTMTTTETTETTIPQAAAQPRLPLAAFPRARYRTRIW